MSQRTLSRLTRPSALRTRAGVLAAGLGVSSVLGVGAAFAATGGDHAAPAAGPSVSAAVASADAVHQQAVSLKSDADSRAKLAASWSVPVKKYTLSATFGRGGSMWSHKHSGQDFAVPVGTTVRAAHTGTVVKAGPNGAGDGPAYGNAIVIKHKNGTYSQYAHLSRIDVRVGQAVTTGQKIALSGNTGNSSGPHLHFEIRTTPNYGSAVNPVDFLRSVGVRV
ncbi:M23 family metallopeptidase [Streptomyces sp. NPDC093085]|uniref:M23 family metallopeptidase n=1 Tax=Streptomyces sp. NPDC093085 TaxID=3155068 RepID=UPI003424E5E2